jgi:hypothetical protein
MNFAYPPQNGFPAPVVNQTINPFENDEYLAEDEFGVVGKVT